jgi:hypothetical protein
MSHLHFDLLTGTVRDLLSKSCGVANRAGASLANGARPAQRSNLLVTSKRLLFYVRSDSCGV